jgi:hypothetical protein
MFAPEGVEDNPPLDPLEQTMETKHLIRSVTAAALVTTGAFALAPAAGATVDPSTCTTTERWPAETNGRPAAHLESAGVYVWHTATGWRLRVNDPGVDRAVFTGSIKVDGRILSVGRHLENRAEGVVNVGPQKAVFRFVNYGGVDGLNFVTKCSTTLTINVKRNGVTVGAADVHIGASGANPTAAPFTINRTA